MPVLNVEHVARQRRDPAAMAAWDVEHLGMRVVRRIRPPPDIHFLGAMRAAARSSRSTPNPAADPVPD